MRSLSFLVAGFVGLVLCGCGNQSMAPVKGQVVFNGQPVKNAAVTFSPSGAPGQKETGKPGTGFTDEDGRFQLSTFSNYDGALLGTHAVLVTLDDTNPAKCKREKSLSLEVKPGPNEFKIEMDPR
jgi:hypothetical protein